MIPEDDSLAFGELFLLAVSLSSLIVAVLVMARAFIY